jgi:hypothetical protein
MSGLPAIDPASLPADIRKGPAAQRKAYEAGLTFERQLVQQLATAMSNTTKPDGDSDTASGDAASESYRQQLPDTLAGAVMSAGGLGLARQLMKASEAGR